LFIVIFQTLLIDNKKKINDNNQNEAGNDSEDSFDLIETVTDEEEENEARINYNLSLKRTKSVIINEIEEDDLKEIESNHKNYKNKRQKSSSHVQHIIDGITKRVMIKDIKYERTGHYTTDYRFSSKYYKQNDENGHLITTSIDTDLSDNEMEIKFINKNKFRIKGIECDKFLECLSEFSIIFNIFYQLILHNMLLF
jgi:hypothetical protein